MTQLPPAYNAKDHEDRLYARWEKSGAFTPKIDPKKKQKPFTIAIPPPNATGELHLGHATMLAIEDIMIRHHRMMGESALWIPGTDHAAIATQNRVEKIIAQEEAGKTRQSMGRKAFIQRVKEYVAGSQDTIRNQMRKMGASVDWTRERYTLDDDLSVAVRTAFVRLYKDGLIYRGHRIVNWCTRCSSTLADDELEYREEKTKFYYLKYGPVVIGTARPETKFHDKIIIVHPKDKRYKKWVGHNNKELDVPWITGTVKAKFVADESADMKMGSGAMTITPAHSFVDFDLAKKYGFEIVQIIDEQGRITEKGGKFKGMTTLEAREKVVEVLAKKGLVERIDENYVHNLSVCYRCDTPIEPLVSEQWFIDVNKKVKGKSLKQRAIEVVRKGKIEIIPDRFNKTYFHWMENLRDWCISRQIWWGHRIPVWYCEKKSKPSCQNPIVSVEDVKKCPHCGSTNLRQDPDTLDTWFSSGMWTFSTLGWPKKPPYNKDLATFHPTSVLETGYDILFFWVARMILLTTYLLDDIPFKTVYLHGLIRDKEGRKMSKSLGNGINPLDMIDKYGTDAVRLSLVLGSSPGNDMRLYEEKIAGYRNFVNKIWNGARFALMNLSPEDFNASVTLSLSKGDPKTLTLPDQWILHRLNEVVSRADAGLAKYRLSEVGTLIYDFFWSEYCDWYLEMSKVHTNKPVLAHVLKTLLTLLHPFTPFVTEALWEKMGKTDGANTTGDLITSAWPKPNPKHKFPAAKRDMQTLIQIITAIRQMRADQRVEPAKWIRATLYGHRFTGVIAKNEAILKQLARVEHLTLTKEGAKLKNAISQVVGGVEIYLPMEGLIDREKEQIRLKKEIENLEGYLKGLNAKLSNKGYLKNAPAAVVEADKLRAKEAEERLAKMRGQVKTLN